MTDTPLLVQLRIAETTKLDLEEIATGTKNRISGGYSGISINDNFPTRTESIGHSKQVSEASTSKASVSNGIVSNNRQTIFLSSCSITRQVTAEILTETTNRGFENSLLISNNDNSECRVQGVS